MVEILNDQGLHFEVESLGTVLRKIQDTIRSMNQEVRKFNLDLNITVVLKNCLSSTINKLLNNRHCKTSVYIGLASGEKSMAQLMVPRLFHIWIACLAFNNF